MQRGLAASLIGVLAAASIAAGCGGGGGDATAAALSKAEFTKQANAICGKAERTKDKSILAYEKKEQLNSTARLTTEVEETMVTDLGLPPIQVMVEELNELGAPSGDEEKVAAIIGEYEAAIEKIEADPGTALEGDPFSEANELATEYGLTVCAEL